MRLRACLSQSDPASKTGAGPARLASPAPVDGICTLRRSRARRIRATARLAAMFNYSSLAAWYAVRMALAMSAVRSPEQSPTQVTGTVTPSRSNALALEPTAITT